MPEQYTIVGDASQQQAVAVLPCRTPCNLRLAIDAANPAIHPSHAWLALIFAQPVLEPKTADASKFTFVVSYDHVTKRKCLSGDQQIIGADRLAGSF